MADRETIAKGKQAPGVKPYKARGRVYWKIDTYLSQPVGDKIRFRERDIPTKEAALARLAQATLEAYEGRHFEVAKKSKLIARGAWNLYSSKSEQVRSHASDKSRWKSIDPILGDRLVAALTAEDVDNYRKVRRTELTRRRRPPSDQTLDHELRLLNRCFNWAVVCKKLSKNPLAGVGYLDTPNVRQRMVNPEQLEAFLSHCPPHLAALVLLYFDTGMRKTELLDLRQDRLELQRGVLQLRPEDTKTEEGRTIVLTERCLEALSALPRGLKGHQHVFRNPLTGRRWVNLRRAWKTATEAAGLSGLWLHDLRRSFITNARRAGVDESTIMRMSGHRTREVFKRYNIVEESDLRAAVKRIEAHSDGQRMVKAVEGGRSGNTGA